MHFIRHIFLFLCLFPALCSAQQSFNADSIKTVIENATNDTLRFKAIKYWDDQIYRYDKDLDEKLNLQLISLVEKSKTNKKLSKPEKKFFDQAAGHVYNTLGIIYAGYGEFEKAVGYYNKSQKSFAQVNNPGGQAKAVLNKGGLYFKHGKYAEAMDSYLFALKIHEKQNNHQGIGLAHTNIGVLARAQGDTIKAMKHYEKGLKHYRLANHKEGLALVITNIANILIDEGKLEEGKKMYEEALAIQTEIGDIRGKSTTLINLSQIKMNLKNYEGVEDLLMESLKIRESLNYMEGIAHSNYSLGYYYSLIGQYDKSIDYCTRSYKMADESGLKSTKELACACLYNSYNFKGNAPMALKYFIEKTSIHDSLLAEEKQREIFQKELQFEFEKKAAADSLRQANAQAIKDARQKEELKHEQTIRYFLFGGLALVLIFALFIFNRLRVISNQKKVIEEQKLMVEEKQKEIIDSIHYAKRIQRALMPSDKYIERNIKPKN